MSNNLQNLFPVLRTRQDLLQEIQTHSHLLTQFQGWSPEQQKDFLDFCTGVKGVKMLYDSFFKEIMNPETTPERLEAFKKVYTIILFEKSTKEFHEFPNIYVHHSEQKSDTGLKLELLQDYTFIALDIFQKNLQNKGISNQLDAWLTFLSVDEPETIVNLITTFPQFKPMYDEVYQLCRNTEKVMEMFSKELQELDRNTVQYMIDEMQDMINAQKGQIETQQDTIDAQQLKLSEMEQELLELRKKLSE